MANPLCFFFLIRRRLNFIVLTALVFKKMPSGQFN